jgi:4-hydroxy-3-methylbut-2-enyl diphosphate reductase
VDTGEIRHKPEIDPTTPELNASDWIPEGAFTLGITAGASTPNNKIGEAVLRILEIRGIDASLETQKGQPA